MDETQAIEITDACMEHVLFREGIRTAAPRSLANYSLRELLDANETIANGTKARMHCDQRLVAALYVAYHYDAQDPAELDAVALKPGAAVVVIKTGEGER
jgi:hypothetical protein